MLSDVAKKVRVNYQPQFSKLMPYNSVLGPLNAQRFLKGLDKAKSWVCFPSRELRAHGPSELVRISAVPCLGQGTGRRRGPGEAAGLCVPLRPRWAQLSNGGVALFWHQRADVSWWAGHHPPPAPRTTWGDRP